MAFEGAWVFGYVVLAPVRTIKPANDKGFGGASPGATNGTSSHEPGERGGQVEQQRTFQDEMEKLRSHLSEAINGHPGQQQPLK
jgi:hypothetical protein